MDRGTLVYSNTAATSNGGAISIGHHTSAIYFLNLDTATSALVKLNNQHTVLIGHTPVQTNFRYTEIPGDYTSFQILTANVILSVYAIG